MYITILSYELSLPTGGVMASVVSASVLQWNATHLLQLDRLRNDGFHTALPAGI